MDLQQAIKLRILQLCKERNITVNKLATLSGINPSTVNSIVIDDTKNVQVITILRICLGLNIQLKDFFDNELFKDLDDE